MALVLQELVTFQAKDRQGNSVYHTNVVMAVGTDVAVVCLESVADKAERQRLKASLSVHHEASLLHKSCEPCERSYLDAGLCRTREKPTVL